MKKNLSMMMSRVRFSRHEAVRANSKSRSAAAKVIRFRGALCE